MKKLATQAGDDAQLVMNGLIQVYGSCLDLAIKYVTLVHMKINYISVKHCTDAQYCLGFSIINVDHLPTIQKLCTLYQRYPLIIRPDLFVLHCSA